jgi:hypothetical protein
MSESDNYVRDQVRPALMGFCGHLLIPRGLHAIVAAGLQSPKLKVRELIAEQY